MAVPEHRIPVSICLRNSANFVCVRCQAGNLWSKSVSHTLNAICLSHGNHTTALYWQFYQHHNITESESTTGKKYPNVHTLHKTWCGEGGKAAVLSGKQRKLNHVTSYSNPGPPFSVREFNFLPLSQAQLARKISFQVHLVRYIHFSY